MNGAGNDFVVADNRDGKWNLQKEQIARLCDRHRGVGADGLLLVEPPERNADFRMRYYNSDGGEAEMCGNGARCFARFVEKIAGPRPEISFETPAGVIRAKYHGELVELTMSTPADLQLNKVIEIDGGLYEVHSVNTGVPHAIVLVDDLDRTDVRKLGAAIRYHTEFAPRGTNVNFVTALSHSSLAIRTYERGVEDETLACGTGVVAAAIIHHSLSGDAAPISVRVKGGETLVVGFDQNENGFTNATLTGPADFVFEGEIALEP